MGRTALLMVLALSFAFAYIRQGITDNAVNATGRQVQYFSYMDARNLSRTGINAGLRKLDRNETLDETHPYRVQFNSGICSVYVRSIIDTMWMTSNAHVSGEIYSIQCKLYKGTKPFPGVNGAVGMRATPVKFNMSGTPGIDGRNYNADGTALVGSGDKPGVATMTSADSSLVKTVGGTRIQGSPATKVDTNIANPLSYVSEYRLCADQIYGPGVKEGDINWGTSTQPVVIFVETSDTNQVVKFTGNVVGWGILVIKGNLEIGGTFKFHGLVIVYGENNIVNASAAKGTPDIIGGLILAGSANTSLDMRGSSNFKYSSEALQKAKNIGKLRYYSIGEWYEGSATMTADYLY
jgi:hypothetical protein